MSKSIQIKKAEIHNIIELSEICKSTFTETYGNQNTPENLQKYLDDHFNQEQLLKELLIPNTTFLLVEFEDCIIGYAKLRVNNTEFLDKNGLELERIYLKNEFHGKKFGMSLIQECILFAQSYHYDFIWLGVWEYNLKAIHFYKKCGFEICGSHIFQLGNDAQTDYLMKKDLKIH